MINVGFIGLGNHAEENLLPALTSVSGINLFGMSSRSDETLNKFKNIYNVENIWNNWHDLVNSKNIDAVFISAPPDAHYQIGSAAIKKGKHVFVEKPPVNNVEELNKITDLVIKNDKLKYFVGYNFIYSDTYKQLIENVSAEGQIRHLNIKFISSKPQTNVWHCTSVEESYFMTVGIHALAIVFDILGDFTSYHYQYTKLDEQKFTLIVNIICRNGTACLHLGNYGNKFDYSYECINTYGGIGYLDNQNKFSFNNINLLSSSNLNVFGGKYAITYEYPPLWGGYQRTGYTREIELFRDLINDKRKENKSLSISIEIYRLMNYLIQDITKEKKPI